MEVLRTQLRTTSLWHTGEVDVILSKVCILTVAFSIGYQCALSTAFGQRNDEVDLRDWVRALQIELRLFSVYHRCFPYHISDGFDPTEELVWRILCRQRDQFRRR